jgi:hypothetical protein
MKSIHPLLLVLCIEAGFLALVDAETQRPPRVTAEEYRVSAAADSARVARIGQITRAGTTVEYRIPPSRIRGAVHRAVTENRGLKGEFTINEDRDTAWKLTANSSSDGCHHAIHRRSRDVIGGDERDAQITTSIVSSP